jgi:hypothetical protein
MKNKFLNICIGTGILFLSGGFFIRSINSANAAPPSPKEFIEEGTTKIGKYQMALGNNDAGNIRVLVWDTETGKAQLFSEKLVNNEWTIAPSVYTIPDHTLGK